VLVAVASLHHRWTWGGLVESPRAFVAVEALASAVLIALVVVQSRTGPDVHSSA
jgi:hypothetical protein